MADITPFPHHRVRPPMERQFAQAIATLEDTAEMLAGHDEIMVGYGDLLRLLTRLLVAHFGPDRAYEALGAAMLLARGHKPADGPEDEPPRPAA